MNLPLGSQIDPPDGVPTTVDGFTFTPGPNNSSGLNDSHYGNAVIFWAYNGTHVMCHHDDVIMTKEDGSAFSLSSFDFAGFPGGEATFTVTGQPGNIVATFTPDGLVDGIGGVEDFQTFVLPPTFINLTSVTWEHSGPATLQGIFGLDNIMVDVSRNHPPDCSLAAAEIPLLWPPDHQLASVIISGVTDPDGDPVTITVTGVTQDEPLNGSGDGNTCPDAIIDKGAAQVRWERAGSPRVPGNGRVYAIAFTASDGQDVCAGVVKVCVPHDQSSGTCIDDGQRVNSLGPCAKSLGALTEEDPVASVELRVIGRTGSAVELEYVLPQDSDVQLSAYDLAGRKVATLVNTREASGAHQVSWNPGGLARGIYYLRMRAGAVLLGKSILILR